MRAERRASVRIGGRKRFIVRDGYRRALQEGEMTGRSTQ